MKASSTAIVAGQFKGLKLRTGRGNGIRPTQALVREAIFNLLPDLSGDQVLDLYAGAGTLGFEALSRGAASVTFVERSGPALKLLTSNREKFKDENITIVRGDCLAFLKRANTSYDVILADPPYGKVDLMDLIKWALQRSKTGGIVVLETSARQAFDNGEAVVKRYGDTQVALIRKPS